MDANHETSVEELFKRKHALLVLDCLYTEGPMRWTDVRQAISSRTGTLAGDQTVTRPLEVLQRLGLAAKNGKRGNRLYMLTPFGTDMARQLQDLYTELHEHQHRDDDDEEPR